VRPAAPVNVNTNNDPEPDAAVVKGTLHDYLLSGTPHAGDMDLVVEVSDTTVSWDRGGKSELYARGGVAEYWVVHINARTLKLEVHRQPTSDGYAFRLSLSEEETVSPEALPEAVIRIADLLP
jgi:Uma2 family endonuclease